MCDLDSLKLCPKRVQQWSTVSHSKDTDKIFVTKTKKKLPKSSGCSYLPFVCILIIFIQVN